MTENEKIHIARIRLLLSSSNAALVTSIAVAAVLVYVQSDHISLGVSLIWFALTSLIALSRIALSFSYRRADSIRAVDLKSWLVKFRVGVLASGLAWGSTGLLLFPEAQPDHQLFLIFALAGMTAGGLISYAADLASALLFTLPTAGPLIIRESVMEGSTSVGFGMSLAMLLYLAFMLVVWRSMNRQINENLSLHLAAAEREEIAHNNAETARINEERYRLLLTHSPVGILHYDTNCIITYCNARFADILHNTAGHLIGVDMNLLRDKSVLPALQEPLRGAVGYYEGHYAATHSDASVWIAMTCAPSLNAAGEIIGGVAIVQDVSERKQAEFALQQSRAELLEAQRIAHVGNWQMDIKTNHVYWSEELYRMLGLSPDSAPPDYTESAKLFTPDSWARLSTSIARAAETGAPYELELEMIRADGSKGWMQARGEPVRDQHHVIVGVRGVATDITERKQYERQIEHIAHYDALTNLPNRVLLADRMSQALAQAARKKTLIAVCYLDLDGFKPINDTLGHAAGDEVLIEVAQRIEHAIRGGDTVARLGGDEFVVLLQGLADANECSTTLERILAAIAEPYSVNGQSLTLTASIGVSLFPQDDSDTDTLLRHADQAMYIAKQGGKNRYYIYDTALDKRMRSQKALYNEIRDALIAGQFELYYQPKINLASHALVGAEALIRWRHPERGLLAPGEFLRYIENTDLDIELGEWVTATALNQLTHWHGQGLSIEVSINISGHHLESPRFVERLSRQIAHHPELPAGSLQIEVLETIALNDIGVVRKIIEACRAIGVGFALDDFGTGYSSLAYLNKLPVDVLKIDQSFVRDMLEDKGDHAIVQGIIALSRTFELKTVAEGIETAGHYLALLEMGCEFGQGYGIARPMPAKNLLDWSRERSPNEVNA